jgi:hypothetical protein
MEATMENIIIPTSTQLLQVNVVRNRPGAEHVTVEIPSVKFKEEVPVEVQGNTKMSEGAPVRVFSDTLGDAIIVRTNLGLFATDLDQLNSRGYILEMVEDAQGNSLHVKDLK